MRILGRELSVRRKTAPFGLAQGFVLSGHPGELPRLGTRQLLEGYNIFPWLRAVVDKIADIAADSTWTVTATNKNGKVVPLPNHPLNGIINDGNDIFSGLVLRQLAFKSLLITGELFWLKERNRRGMPIALWPIPSSWVQYAPVFAGPDSYYVVHYRNWNVRLAMSEVVHIWEPNPLLPYGRGSGRAASLSDELETDEYAARHMKAFFYNSARPDLLITSDSVDAPMSPTDVERLEQRWFEKLGGWMRAHKPFFLSGGPVKVTQMGGSFADMQIIDLRKFSRDIVLQVYGLPPESLGIIENSNRATIDAAEFFLTKHVVRPKLHFLKAEIKHKIIPDFDKRLDTEYTNPVQIDKEQRIEIMKAAPHAFSIDDIRSAADSPAYGGDKGALHAVPLNYQLINLETGDGLTPINPANPQDGDPQDNPSDGPDDPPQERSMKDAGEEAQGRVQHVIDILRRHPELLLSAAWLAMRGPMLGTVEAFGKFEFGALGSDGEFIIDPSVRAFLDNWANDRGVLIDGTTGAALADALQAALDNGANLNALSQAVTAYFDNFPAGRMNDISSTETGLAATFAQTAAFKQLGVKHIEWLSQRDDKVRLTHQALDGTVIASGETFKSPSGAEATAPRMFGVPEEDVNCRCFTVPRTDIRAARDDRWAQLNQILSEHETIVAGAVKRAFKRQAQLVRRALRA